MTTASLSHLGVMAALGFGAATIGSLSGLSGGFIVAPALRIFFDVAPDEAAATALVLALANVMSASIAFVRQRRVDLKLAAVVGCAAIPTSIAGAFAVRAANATSFDVLYAAMLALFALTLLRRRSAATAPRRARLPWSRERSFHDALTGGEQRYLESVPLEAGTGLVTGFLSSFFGIGGGTFVVPVLLRFFAMPAHVASATSHMIILFSAPFGVAAHALAGDIIWLDALPLALGGLAGGQAGAYLSRRLPEAVLVRIVAVVLVSASASLFYLHAEAW